MMINNLREKAPQAKQDGGGSGGGGASSTSSSRTWAGLKDARIVRVVRSLGGKDRHSKVSTVRGLRDRRVRLSVPTAIQLYDLQDRLGVSQPSKAVDWLLDAARHEIDKLPPLKIPPGTFLQFPESAAAAAAASDHGVSLFLPEREEEEDQEEEDPSPSPMAAAAAVDWRAKRRGSPSVWEAHEEGKSNGLFTRIEQAAPPHSAAVPVRSDVGNGCSSMLGEHHSSYHLPASSAQLCAPHLGCYQLSQQGGEALQGYAAAPIDPPLTMFSPYAAAAAAAAAGPAAGYDHRQANGFQLGSSAAQGFLLGYLPGGAGALHGSSAAGGGANMRPLQVTIASRLSPIASTTMTMAPTASSETINRFD